MNVVKETRKLLEKIGGFDVSKEALGFMEWKEGKHSLFGILSVGAVVLFSMYTLSVVATLGA